MPQPDGARPLLAEWARRTRDRQPVAWLTLDETDDEPQRFWTYVVTALLTTTPGLGDAALVALRVPGIDPIDVALPALLNDLSGTDAKQTLILDDYHTLTDANPRGRRIPAQLPTAVATTGDRRAARPAAAARPDAGAR